ncbi:MAG: hypothetical protein KJZ91_29455 [Myxococcales bacterium]|nr:hypothetical protein [Myxococcales bacterium]
MRSSRAVAPAPPDGPASGRDRPDRPRPVTVAGALAAALAAGACADTADDRPARWAYVHAAIVAPACATAGCHSTLAATAGLDLSSATGAYTFLTGRICGEPVGPGSPPRSYVEPGSPERSQLVYQLRGAGRALMPPDVPLPEVEIQLVERWIEEGAPCD